MGKEKYQTKVETLFNKSAVVDAASIRRIVRGNYEKQLIRNLIKKGKIKKLTKGYYTKHNENSLIVACYQPAYLGLQDAMSFHNLWEQETIPIVITTKKVRVGIKKVMDGNCKIKKIDEKYFFGYDYVKSGDFFLPYSDIEKTIIDMIYFNENIDKEVIFKADIKKLKSYLKRYPKKFRDKVKKKLKSY